MGTRHERLLFQVAFADFFPDLALPNSRTWVALAKLSAKLSAKTHSFQTLVLIQK